MSGRHRKPTTATTTKTFAKVALTGAVLGGGAALLGTGTANAATDAEWNQVAQCESGGNWSINTGNGYHGGLQFSPSTWSGYGGGEFAPTADQATKEQQIVVAERVLAGQGKGAWPTCGTGLSGATQRSAPAAPKPAPVLPKLPELPAPFDWATAPDAGSTADVNKQIDQALGQAIDNNQVTPEVRDLWKAAKQSGYELTPDQIDLFNQHKDQLPNP
ncbi:transglycosylase family protein [Gordonia sp. Z-3]|jgi:hypothetical protein|uniref:Transglycosylase family protein n=2 Tax=Gordonia TaxID=2053 RepID=A0A9X3D5X8_9ACTN|nr:MULTISPECIES: transglycosylase family protein [Gordonia]MAU84843.1 transglycosylase [Gordonia sp. (in: high G+C Gram-positive bacteria)]MCF3941000.1 transglycosylase family protein [Gordonia tangerina]MCX2965558.1 transglycosylase family protein [Gordonia aquimaris]MED5800059.1 transglycosylase family protein [Gordonia sp. Z-3]